MTAKSSKAGKREQRRGRKRGPQCHRNVVLVIVSNFLQLVIIKLFVILNSNILCRALGGLFCFLFVLFLCCGLFSSSLFVNCFVVCFLPAILSLIMMFEVKFVRD